MIILKDGAPSSKIGFRWLPYAEYDDDTGCLLWGTIGWREWLRHWLPAHVVNWQDEWQLERCIREHGQYGNWWHVPFGYDVAVIRKPVGTSGASGDPLDRQETIGLKFTWDGKET